MRDAYFRNQAGLDREGGVRNSRKWRNRDGVVPFLISVLSYQAFRWKAVRKS